MKILGSLGPWTSISSSVFSHEEHQSYPDPWWWKGRVTGVSGTQADLRRSTNLGFLACLGERATEEMHTRTKTEARGSGNLSVSEYHLEFELDSWVTSTANF